MIVRWGSNLVDACHQFPCGKTKEWNVEISFWNRKKMSVFLWRRVWIFMGRWIMSGRHLSLFPGHTLRSSLSPSSSSTLYYLVQKPKCQEGAILFVHKRDKKKRLLTSPPYRQKNEQTGRRLMLSWVSPLFFFEKSATNESITAPCAPARSHS